MIEVDNLAPGLTPRATPLPEEPEPSTLLGRQLDSGQQEPGYLKSAFDLENSVINAFDYLHRPEYPEDPDYNPLEDERIKGTKFEQAYLDNFIGVRSREEATGVISRVEREEKLREIVARGGLAGWVSAVAAGVVDPLVLVPVGGWATTAIRGGRAARAAVRAGEGAAVAGGAVAAQEGILQTAQETRTTFESVFAISAGTILGGVLGGAAGALSRAEIDRLGRAANDGLPETLEQEGRLFDRAVAGAGAEATAAARGTGELAGALGSERVFRFQDPLIRLQTSPLQSARDTVRDLAETPLTLAENAEGIATTTGGAVETRMKMAEGPLAQGIVEMDRAFSDYFFGRRVKMAAARAGLARMVGRAQGRMSYPEFKEQVWQALLDGDVHAIPEVRRSAQALRRHVFEPPKNEAIQLKLFDEGVQPLDDAGYVPRVYNTRTIAARRNEFVEILARNFQNRQDEMLARVDDAEARAGVAEEQAQAAARDVEELSPQEIRAVAEEVTDVIMGHSPNRMIMPSDLVAGPRGPLKERVLRIPTNLIRDFVERDPELLSRMYTRTMASDIGLTKKFGSTDLAEQLRKVNDEANEKIARATTEKERVRLDNQRKAALRDINAIRERLRGTYALPREPDGLAVRSFRALRNLNYLRLLGGMTISAVPDIGRPVMTHGLNRVMRTAFHPLVHGLRTTKLSAKDVKLAGTALDLTLDSRVVAIADVMDDFGRGSKFERGLQAATRNFGIVSIMAPWNAFFKQFSGVITQTRMLEAIDGYARASRKQKEYLAAGGIDATMAARIRDEFRAHGEKDGSVWWANTGDWTDKQAVEAYRAMLVRDVDRIIVTPGQDKPLWMSNELGRVIGQFRSFNISSTQRTIMAGLQQRDAAALNGMMLMLGLGALSYYLKSNLYGYEVSDDPAKWASEAFDRSGLAGWIMDANNITEKVTRGRIGASAFTGEMASRYASRNAIGSLLGPTFDQVGDMIQVTGAMSAATWPESESDVWRESDTHALRKMVPLQNVFYLRGLFDAAERGANSAFGIPMRKRN